MHLRVAGIEHESVVDGPGVRFVVFLQGCRHHCHGCHNKQTWNKTGGYEMTTGEIFRAVRQKELISGVTFSGGEPLDQARELAQLAEMLKHTGYNLWCYTGYTWEEAQGNPVLPYLDVLVDGPFMESEKSLDLLFRGSRNQRLIDVQESLKAGEVVLFKP